MISFRNKWEALTTSIKSWWREQEGSLLEDLWIIFVLIPATPFLFVLLGIKIAICWLMDIYDKTFVQPSRDLLTPEEIEQRVERRKLRNDVKPLPSTRPRALTLDSGSSTPGPEPNTAQYSPLTEKNIKSRWKKTHFSDNPKGLQQSTIDQLGTCDFYKLPYEVREKIWKYAVGGHHIHIVIRKGRLGNVYCPSEDATEPKHRDICCRSRDADGFYLPTAWPRDIQPLGLIMSCRQIYSETIDFVYSLNTFSFDNFDIITAFFASLLPHRVQLISSIHLEYDFDELCSQMYRNVYVEKHQAWKTCYYTLSKLPNLKCLTLTTPCIRGSGRNLRGERFTPAPNWPESQHASGRMVPWLDVDEVLPDDLNLKIRPKSTDDLVEFLGFFIPFNVQCLHCHDYTIIRKATKGYADAALTGISNGAPNNARNPHPPKLTRYWTFHTFCGGWIEFQYDWIDARWSVTQGAKEIGDEEAREHIAACKGRYPELGSPHERLHRMWVKEQSPFPLDLLGKSIDLPTKELFYRNVGWTRDL